MHNNKNNKSTTYNKEGYTPSLFKKEYTNPSFSISSQESIEAAQKQKDFLARKKQFETDLNALNKFNQDTEFYTGLITSLNRKLDMSNPEDAAFIYNTQKEKQNIYSNLLSEYSDILDNENLDIDKSTIEEIKASKDNGINKPDLLKDYNEAQITKLNDSFLKGLAEEYNNRDLFNTRQKQEEALKGSGYSYIGEKNKGVSFFDKAITLYSELDEKTKNDLVEYVWKNYGITFDSDEDYDNVLKNRLFKEFFGEEIYNSKSFEERKDILQDYAVSSLINAKFENDPLKDRLLNLPTDLKIKAYKDSELLNHREIAAIRTSSPPTNFATVDLSPTTHAANYLQEYREEALYDLEGEAQKLLNEETKSISDKLYINTINAYNRGSIDNEDVISTFEELMSEISPEYMVFKGDKELENFSITDMIQYLAEYEAMSKSNPYHAASHIQRKMQKYIHEQQGFWQKLGYTTQGIITGTTSLIVQTGLGLYGLGTRVMEGEDAYAEFMNSKVVNLWNDIEKYNTFSEAALNEARLYGISQYNRIQDPDKLYELSWDSTPWEVLDMGKYVLSAMATGWGAGKLLNAGNWTNKYINTASKLASQGFSQSGMAHTMAKQTFDETVRLGNERIDNKINSEINKLKEDPIIRSQAINKFMEVEGKAAIKEAVLKAGSQYDKKKSKISKDAYLKQVKEQASKDIMQYANDNVESLINTYYADAISNKYKEDRALVQKAAGSAATAQATISWLKETLLGLPFNQWMYASKNRIKIFNRNVPVEYDNAGNAIAKNVTKAAVAGTVAKRLGYGFGEEWFDTHSEHFSQGFGLSYFNDLTADKYNPHKFLEGNNGNYNFLTHVGAGLKSVADGFWSKDGIYEGLIGMISQANINVGHFQNTEKKLKEDFDAGKITKEQYESALKVEKSKHWTEKIQRWATNGIISDIGEMHATARESKEVADAVNKIYADNKDFFVDAAELISTLNEQQKSVLNKDLLSAKDAKTKSLFLMSRLFTDELAKNTPKAQKALSEYKRLAKGNLTEDDINTYINRPENKHLKDNKDGVEIAKQALVDNAKELLDMVNNYDTFMSEINNSTYGKELSEGVKQQLVFNKILTKDIDTRLNSLENKISSKQKYSEINNQRANFNSKVGLDAEIETSKNTITELEKTVEKIEKALNTLDTSSEDYKSKNDALQLHLKTTKELLDIEKDALEELRNTTIDESIILSKEEIMSLNPEQRAKMLDPDNEYKYTKKQNKIIKQLRDELNTTPGLLKDIMDAGVLYSRKRLNLDAYNKILNNHKLYDDYAYNMQKSFWDRAEKTAHRLMVESLYKDFNKIKVKDLKNYFLNEKWSAEIVAGYKEKNVEKGTPRYNTLNEIEDILRIYRTTADIADSKLSENEADRIKNLIKSIAVNSKNSAEIMTSLEKALNNTIESDPVFSTSLSTILQHLALSNYQRDSRVIEDRNKRQEELKKQRKEEAKKKKEALGENEDFKEEEKIDLGIDDKKEGESKETKNQPIKPEDDKQASQSPSLEEQAKQEGVSEVQTIDLSSKDDNEFNENSSTEYTGTPWSEFDNKASSDYHFLEDERASLPKDTKAGDYKKAYFNFIDQNGIKIQEIVDYELAKIFEDNPDVEVHFMMTAVNTDSDGIPFLVIEYTQDVAKHHKDDRGGVITVNDTQWLIIGNAYSGTKEYIDNLIKPLKNERLANMSSEDTYYVSDKFTKIKEVKSGRLVKRQLGEGKTLNRSISELLYTTDEEGNAVYNEERNPSHIGNPNNKKAGYTGIKWGIQKAYNFVTINVEEDKEIKPSSPSDNQGAVFMLIPTTNGKFMPAYINPIHYKPIEDKGGLRDGALKERIEIVALGLLSNSLEKRKKAKDDLRQFLVFDDRTNIEIGSEKMPTLTIVKNGIRVATYDLKQGANIVEILESLNPRINITVSTLNNGILMSEYEAAGALTTDISLLHTRNGSFTIFPIDATGSIDEGDVAVHNSNSETSRIREQRIPLNGVQYSFYDNAWHDENDNVITDANLVQTVEYKKAINGRTAEFTGKSGDSYHILSEDSSNPIVLRVDNKGQIIKQTKEEANNTITRYKADLEAKKAAERAKKEMLEDVNLGIEEAPVVNPTEQLFGNFDSEIKTVTQPQVTQTTETKEVTKEESKNTTNNLDNTKDLTTFESIFEKTSYRRELTKVFREKGWRLGRNAKDVVSFLESKGVSLVGIDNFDNWLDMIKNCK